VSPAGRWKKEGSRTRIACSCPSFFFFSCPPALRTHAFGACPCGRSRGVRRAFAFFFCHGAPGSPWLPPQAGDDKMGEESWEADLHFFSPFSPSPPCTGALQRPAAALGTRDNHGDRPVFPFFSFLTRARLPGTPVASYETAWMEPSLPFFSFSAPHAPTAVTGESCALLFRFPFSLHFPAMSPASPCRGAAWLNVPGLLPFFLFLTIAGTSQGGRALGQVEIGDQGGFLSSLFSSLSRSRPG